MLAASRMFKDHADVSHVDSDSVSKHEHAINCGSVIATRNKLTTTYNTNLAYTTQEDVFDSAHQAVVKHQEKIDESREAFPNASADTFPVLRADSN